MRKTNMILAILLVFGCTSFPVAAWGATFSDLAPSDWGYKEVLSLTDQKIVSGYPDGTFRPDAQITRAEFCKLIAKTVTRGLDPKFPTKPTFPDVDQNHWAYGYVEAVAAQGWVNGFPDGNFRPEQSITKAEVLKILAVASDRPLQTAIPSPYMDSAVHRLVGPLRFHCGRIRLDWSSRSRISAGVAQEHRRQLVAADRLPVGTAEAGHARADGRPALSVADVSLTILGTTLRQCHASSVKYPVDGCAKIGEKNPQNGR